MRKLQVVFLLFTVMIGRFAKGGETSVEKYADKYYTEWNAQTIVDDSGDPFESGDFFSAVPSSLQVDVLDKVLRRGIASAPTKGSTFVKLTALQCLEHLMDDPKKVVVNDAIEADLISLLRSRSSTIRWQVLGIFRVLNKDKYRSFFQEALNDPEDIVRCEAVDALGNFSDSVNILRQYVANHEDDPTYKSSITDAKNALQAMRNGRNFQN